MVLYVELSSDLGEYRNHEAANVLHSHCIKKEVLTKKGMDFKCLGDKNISPMLSVSHRSLLNQYFGRMLGETMRRFKK